MYDEMIWITNYEALNKKYGVDDANRIWNTIIDLYGGSGFDLSDTNGWDFKPVKTPSNCKQNKDAIDAIFKQCHPNYMIIIGASDVIPFQNMKNPCLSTQDDDKFAWGDIPYACDAKYSQDPASFLAPTRVVGRIPDLVGGTDPKYLINVLTSARSAKTQPASDYKSYLGVTAEVWKGSTSLSLKNIFGSSSKMQHTPPKGPKWSKTLLGKRTHFINCHGASANPFFYGQKGNSYPEAHSAALLNGKITAGTVAAAECCYGAELYDPAISGGQPGICSTYLESGAYGFFGSSTIAYGPPDGNGAADLITQFFLKNLLAGASLGRATLMAQQDYIQAEASNTGAIDPVALKTLAQFYLLGDPTIHPVEKAETESKANDAMLLKGVTRSTRGERLSRVTRRQEMTRRGLALSASVAYTQLSKKLKPSTDVLKALKQMAKNMKMKNEELQSYDVKGGAIPKTAFARAVPKRIFHVVSGEIGPPQKSFTPAAVIVAEEQDGQIISVRNYERR